MNKTHALIATLVSAAVLAGCGDGPSKAAVATQVVAKVDDSEISVHQLNHLLSKAPNVPSDQAESTRKRLLQTLVDQELLMAQAKKDQLDRSPDMVIALEVARREVLSRAYLEKVANAVPHPTEQEVQLFYDTNPQLFALRNTYQYRELLVPAGAEQFDAAATTLKNVTSVDGAALLLKQKGTEFKLNRGNRSAEQIPPELLKQLAASKTGDTLLLNNNLGLSVLQVEGVQRAPIDTETAKPIIANLLLSQRKNQAMAKTMEELRKVAKISYPDEKLKPN